MNAQIGCVSVNNHLIDPTGDLWEANSWQLRQWYGARQSNDGFEDFLIKNIGFVALATSSGSATIRAAPALVTYACFTKVSELITQRMPARVALSWFDASWHHEVRRGAVDGRERLMHLMLEAEGNCSTAYGIQPRRTDDLAVGNPLANTLELWRERGGCIDIDEQSEPIRTAIGGKYTIVRRDPDRKTIEFAHFGDGIDLYGSGSWKRRLVGCRVDEQPDLEFGRWLADNYLETIFIGNPALGDIDATTTDIAAKRNVRKIYTRLALPILTGKPGEYLLCASTVHDTQIFPLVAP